MKTRRSKLLSMDFRFADENDVDELLEFLHAVHMHECDPLGFRAEGSVRFTKEELDADFADQSTKWVVMESPVPEELMIGAARISAKTGRVDSLCAVIGAPENADQTTASIEKRRMLVLVNLIRRIEAIIWNTGLRLLILEVPHWEGCSDAMIQLLELCGFEERSGRAWPEESRLQAQLTKPTMIFDFHKDLKLNQELKNPAVELVNTATDTLIDGTCTSSSVDVDTKALLVYPTDKLRARTGLEIDASLFQDTNMQPVLEPAGYSASGMLEILSALESLSAGDVELRGLLKTMGGVPITEAAAGATDASVAGRATCAVGNDSKSITVNEGGEVADSTVSSDPMTMLFRTLHEEYD